MNDQILKSYLNDFIENEGLSDLKESDSFEQFVNFCIISREYADNFDLSNIGVGGGNDTAIDGIAIIVNEHLVFSKEDIDYFREKFNRFEVKFVFIQSKTSPNFNMADIGNFLFGVQSYFKNNSGLVINDDVKYLKELKDYIYKFSIDMDQSPTCDIYYVTTGKWKDDANLQARINAGRSDLENTDLFSTIQFYPVDVDGIKSIYREIKRKIATEVIFDKHTILPKIVGVEEAYIGIVPAVEYLKLITDQDGKLRRNLFDDNVRDYQGNNPVNEEIASTIQDANQSNKFALLNNGITVVAKSINKVGTSFKLRDYQIVNGCQTSHILYFNRNSLTQDVYVPIKIIVTNDNEVTNQIIKATNRQTVVNPEAFEALSHFHKELEEFYRSMEKNINVKLYYERRSKQYASLPIPKQRIITLTAQLKSFLAMFLHEPHSTHRYYGELLKAYKNRLFVEGHSLFPYYVSGYAFYLIEKAFAEQHIDRKFRPYRFQLLMLFRILSEKGSSPYLNSKKMEQYCNSLITTWDNDDVRYDLFLRATNIVQDAFSDGNYHDVRDTTRLKSFTNSLLNRVKATNDVVEARRSRGVIKWFSAVKGYGFIDVDRKDEDAFIHFSDINETGYSYPAPGQRVDFILAKSARGLVAKDVHFV